MGVSTDFASQKAAVEKFLQAMRPAFPNYASGTWGPSGADELMRRDGREWLRH